MAIFNSYVRHYQKVTAENRVIDVGIRQDEAHLRAIAFAEDFSG